jgi:hypothetical protein
MGPLLTINILYFPSSITVRDVLPIKLTISPRINGLNSVLLVTSDQGEFSIYSEREYIAGASEVSLIPYSRIIETGGQMGRKLTSMMLSLAQNAIHSEPFEKPEKSENFRTKDGVKLKSIFHWNDPGRIYLDMIEGSNYTLLADSLGQYSVFDNHDGLFIRRIKEQGASKCLWITGESDLLAIYRPNEKRIDCIRVPFGKEIFSLDLVLHFQDILLKIIANECHVYTAVVLKLSPQGLPILLRHELLMKNLDP